MNEIDAARFVGNDLLRRFAYLPAPGKGILQTDKYGNFFALL